MNTARITKIEKQRGDDFFSVTFAVPAGMFTEDFDLDQLGGVGEDWDAPVIVSKYEDFVCATGVKLKVGDSITDEKGGDPIIAEVHGKTEEIDMTIIKESDHRRWFSQKMSGEGER